MAETKTRARSRAEREDAADDDVAAQVLGSGDPAIQEETRQALIDEIGEEEYLSDPERYWTAQHGPMPDTSFAALHGPQQYLPQQLPDPNVAKLAGIPPQRIPENLVLDIEGDPQAALAHPHGPEPGELVRLVKNDAVNQALIDAADEQPTGKTGGVLTLTSHGMADIRNAQEGERDPGAPVTGPEEDEGKGDTDPEAEKQAQKDTQHSPSTGD